MNRITAAFVVPDVNVVHDIVPAEVVARSLVSHGHPCAHARTSAGYAQTDTGASAPRHRPAPHLYRWLMLAVMAINVAVALRHLQLTSWRLADAGALQTLSTMTLLNLAGAVLIRQQHILNVLYGLAGRGSRSWPLWIRWTISKVHHVGGIHAGCALSGTASLCAFVGLAIATRRRQPALVTPTTLVLCAGLVALMLVVTVCAAPVVRSRAHNAFEWTHRWCGWAAIALFWVLTIHLATTGRRPATVVGAVTTDWHVWVLAIITASVAAPWLRLRRVPISVHRPSPHVAIVHLEDGMRPSHSAAVGISRSPLREWHPFATVAAPGRPDCRLVISRAGDWTGRFIDDPPSHVWVRGVPVVAPMAEVSVLYERVVYVATGSGIGPLLGQILANRVPARLVWSTRDPRRTFGDALVDEVFAAQPGAVIWNTTQQGKPDLLQLALDAVAGFDARAVFVVSNKPTTLGLVADLERRGIPAFGPIWDS